MATHAGVQSFRNGKKPLIALVGGIGAGKSTVAKCFQRRGGEVIDADAIGHSALGEPEVIAAILRQWDGRLKLVNGSLDRRALAAIVFANPEERNKLESIVFPHIRDHCLAAMARAIARSDCRFIVLDAAVMLEAGWKDIADWIVYVDAPMPIRLARVAARNGWSEDDLLARERAQWPAEQKKSLADAVIINVGDREELMSQVDHLLDQWGILAEMDSPGEQSPEVL